MYQIECSLINIVRMAHSTWSSYNDMEVVFVRLIVRYNIMKYYEGKCTVLRRKINLDACWNMQYCNCYHSSSTISDPSSFAASSLTSSIFATQGNTTFHVPRSASTRRTCASISSWSFGTSSSFARLPMRDLVSRSSVNVGGNDIVNVGFADSGSGGVRTT